MEPGTDFSLNLIQYIAPVRDPPMQKYCSELTERLLKSLDKEYNVSKAEYGASRGEMHRAVSVSVRANGYRATLDPPYAVLLPMCQWRARECLAACLCVCMCVCLCSAGRVYVYMCVCGGARAKRATAAAIRACMSIAAAATAAATPSSPSPSSSSLPPPLPPSSWCRTVPSRTHSAVPCFVAPLSSLFCVHVRRDAAVSLAVRYVYAALVLLLSLSLSLVYVAECVFVYVYVCVCACIRVPRARTCVCIRVRVSRKE